MNHSCLRHVGKIGQLLEQQYLPYKMQRIWRWNHPTHWSEICLAMIWVLWKPLSDRIIVPTSPTMLYNYLKSIFWANKRFVESNRQNYQKTSWNFCFSGGPMDSNQMATAIHKQLPPRQLYSRMWILQSIILVRMAIKMLIVESRILS